MRVLPSLATLVVASMLTADPLSAQFNETIRTGRPGQAIGPFAVGQYVFQTQTGIDANRFDLHGTSVSGSDLTPNTVLRFGVTRQFEINGALAYRTDKFTRGDTTARSHGVSTVSIGTRINVTEGHAKLPAVGVQVSLKLPVVAEPYNPSYIAPRAMLIAATPVTARTSLLGNVGIDYNGNDAQPVGVFVANVGYSLSNAWSAFAESYGTFGSGASAHYWDTGIAWMVNEHLQFDAYGGFGDNGGRRESFVSAGVSWRVLTRKRVGN